jgi:hypothetical protein
MHKLSIRGRPLITFARLVSPVLQELDNLWWRFDGSCPFQSVGVTPTFPSDAELETLFLRTEPWAEGTPQNEWDIGWLRPGKVGRMAPFVVNDWLAVFASATPLSHSALSQSPNDLILRLDCIDGSQWDAQSEDSHLLSKLAGVAREAGQQWESSS